MADAGGCRIEEVFEAADFEVRISGRSAGGGGSGKVAEILYV